MNEMVDIRLLTLVIVRTIDTGNLSFKTYVDELSNITLAQVV